MIKLIVTASSIFSLTLLCTISVFLVLGTGVCIGEALGNLKQKYGSKVAILAFLIFLTIVSFVIAAFLIKTGR